MRKRRPTFIIKNNTSSVIPVELFKNPQAPSSPINGSLTYTWNICSILLTDLTTVVIQARLNTQSAFTSYSANIAISSLAGLLAALNSIGIGFFYSQIIDGELSIVVNSSEYIYSDLDINDSDIADTASFCYEIVFNVSDPAYVFIVYVNGFNQYQAFNLSQDCNTVPAINGDVLKFETTFTNSHSGTILLYKNGCLISSSPFTGIIADVSTDFGRNGDLYSVVVNVNT